MGVPFGAIYTVPGFGGPPDYDPQTPDLPTQVPEIGGFGLGFGRVLAVFWPCFALFWPGFGRVLPGFCLILARFQPENPDFGQNS